jgi:LysM repeat protein
MQRLFCIAVVASLVSACAPTKEAARTEPPAPPPQVAPAPAPEPRRVEPPPPPATPPAASNVEQTYTVKKGDTLAKIAKDHNVAVHDLAEWNQIKDARRIKIGQQLRLTAP